MIYQQKPGAPSRVASISRQVNAAPTDSLKDQTFQRISWRSVVSMQPDHERRNNVADMRVDTSRLSTVIRSELLEEPIRG
jgi:hypothetical protein